MEDLIKKINSNFIKKVNLLKRLRNFIFFILILIFSINALIAYYIIFKINNSTFKTVFLLCFFGLGILLFILIIIYTILFEKLYLYNKMIENLDENIEKECLERLYNCEKLLNTSPTYYIVQKEYISLKTFYNNNFNKLSIGACMQVEDFLNFMDCQMVNFKLK